MLWTVLLGFGTGRERPLAGLQRTYERVTGKSLVPSSFYDRFSKEVASGAMEYGHWLAPVDAESLSPRIIARAPPGGFPSHPPTAPLRLRDL